MIAGGLLNKQNSLILKGGGIILMLVHHLFYSKWSQAYYDDIYLGDIGVVNQIAIFCKLCVAIFVFLSGYGLVASTPGIINLKKFYLHRFKKLYLNYWYIWIIFVPISYLFFGRTFTDAYGNHIIIKSVLDFLGLLKMFGYDGYNPTWWFYSCIIILYLLFPILHKYLLKSTYFLVSLAVACGLLHFVPGVNVIGGYFFAFLLGMLMAKMPVEWIQGTKMWQVILSLVFLSIWRMTDSCPKHIADGLLCTGLAMLVNKITIWDCLKNIMVSLGKHSMNMFLTHTFIYYFWFSKYIYITRNPILIFFSLLVSSYLLSVFIEWTKNKIGFYKL